jgi:hypothetical protein
MGYRLIENNNEHGNYGRVITLEFYKSIPYYDKCLFEPPNNMNPYPINIHVFKNGIEDTKNIYSFHEWEDKEYTTTLEHLKHSLKQTDLNILEAPSIPSLKGKHLIGTCIVIIKQ